MIKSALLLAMFVPSFVFAATAKISNYSFTIPPKCKAETQIDNQIDLLCDKSNIYINIIPSSKDMTELFFNNMQKASISELKESLERNANQNGLEVQLMQADAYKINKKDYFEILFISFMPNQQHRQNNVMSFINHNNDIINIIGSTNYIIDAVLYDVRDIAKSLK